MKGRLCKACILKHFLLCNLHNTLFGWWGFLSFFVNLFALAFNTFAFLKCFVLGGDLGGRRQRAHPQRYADYQEKREG